MCRKNEIFDFLVQIEKQRGTNIATILIKNKKIKRHVSCLLIA